MIFSSSFSQTDSTRIIKVVFLYGSKPLRKYKSTESKFFGGLHGGHVTLQLDDIDYGFEPASNHVHVFARKSKNSDFVDRSLKGNNRYSSESKTVTFFIPISETQYENLTVLLKSYSDTIPYDYAFFGMRCASTTQDVLGQIGVVEKRRRFANIFTTFYPKKLRKRLFRLAKEKNYDVVKTTGELERKWEKD
jgi:hypothetical protein